jgi:hypothetical protein
VDALQVISRAYRHGNKGVTVITYIVEGTVEEGMHEIGRDRWNCKIDMYNTRPKAVDLEKCRYLIDSVRFIQTSRKRKAQGDPLDAPLPGGLEETKEAGGPRDSPATPPHAPAPPAPFGTPPDAPTPVRLWILIFFTLRSPLSPWPLPPPPPPPSQC